MADPEYASRKDKAEGERWTDQSSESKPGITNRSMDEEMSNQESLPRRGESKPGAHAGHGDSSVEDSDDRRSER